MKKKTVKVKRKKVKYTKSKKTTKKKVVHKKKRKRRKKMKLEDLYPILNKVQMTGKPTSFVVKFVDAAVIENTIKDLGLSYRRNDMKTQVEFSIKANEYTMIDMEDELMEIEYLDDEIPEIGEIFP